MTVGLHCVFFFFFFFFFFAVLSMAVDLLFQVGDKLIHASGYTVDLSQSVDCCVAGDAVECLMENADGSSLFCVNIFTPCKYI